MHYDRLTRFLHIWLALGILTQLLVSVVMSAPKHGRPGDAFYDVHEHLGVALWGLLLLYWGWVMVRRGKVPLSQLFPWFTPARYAPLWDDVRLYTSHILRFRLPDSTAPSPLANAVQGLGLLIALLLGTGGLVMFLNAPANGQMTGWLHGVKEMHEVLGSLMWAYLGLHASMGVLHQIAGHGSLKAMFWNWQHSAGA